MDIIDRHFAAENAHDVGATLETYAEDLVWDDVANPACPIHGKRAAAAMYEGIIDAIPDLNLESVKRFSSGDYVVDESIVTGHIHGSFVGVEGGGAPVNFRMLHVFELRDSLIAMEQAWFDSAGVIRQIEAYRAAGAGAVHAPPPTSSSAA
jgi:steroid delta-isomerase-like uncharacterized protein